MHIIGENCLTYSERYDKLEDGSESFNKREFIGLNNFNSLLM
jgi:hypothetical protein